MDKTEWTRRSRKFYIVYKDGLNHGDYEKLAAARAEAKRIGADTIFRRIVDVTTITEEVFMECVKQEART